MASPSEIDKGRANRPATTAGGAASTAAPANTKVDAANIELVGGAGKEDMSKQAAQATALRDCKDLHTANTPPYNACRRERIAMEKEKESN